MKHLIRYNYPALLIMAVAVAMIGFGVYRGEMEIVLKKAIVICLECIGIG